MYKRLSQEEIELIKREQQNDRLFINLYDAIGAVGLDFDDISPEEIWKEASAQVRIIANAEQRTFSVKTLHTSMGVKTKCTNGRGEGSERKWLLFR